MFCACPHIHPDIDFTVCVFIVYANKVLFIKHKALGIWLQVGGHVELNEDPEAAALREVKEESGLDVELIGERPTGEHASGRYLIAPVYMDIHRITPTHRHIGMVYFARAKTDQVTFDPAESDDIRWMSATDLDDPQYDILPQIRFFAHEALKRCA
jgi:ADP-ribose pyrophosphatase YjhB (NUDIX family)